MTEIIARFGPRALLPYASSVIGKPNKTAFENKIQKPIVVASENVQLKKNRDPIIPSKKHKIAPEKKLKSGRQLNTVSRSKVSIHKKKKIGIAIVCEYFKTAVISEPVNIPSLTAE